MFALARYLIEYSVSDIDGTAATPLTLSITFVEVALVTGSFLFIGQADNATEAQQYAEELYTLGTACNSVLVTDVAAVFQTWLTSATSAYVESMTAALGADSAATAAVNVLELGLFSSISASEVMVLNATIDQNITNALNVNTSDATQNYAYNVTLQVTVLTADMLLSVFVDVLNSTLSSKRRLLSSSDQTLTTVNPQIDSTSRVTTDMISRREQARQVPGIVLGDMFCNEHELDGGMALNTLTLEKLLCRADRTQHVVHNHHNPAVRSYMVDESAQSGLQSQRMALQAKTHSRGLQTTSSGSAFPLTSLLTFKMNLVLAAFNGTSGCSPDSLVDLFYEGSEAPASLPDLCTTAGGTEDVGINQALLASANSTVPLLQVDHSLSATLAISGCIAYIKHGPCHILPNKAFRNVCLRCSYCMHES